MADNIAFDANRPFVVYGHRLPGSETFFHIGSGSHGRAFEPTRGKPWRDFIAGTDGRYEVVIIERHSCEARARLREAELIFEHQPETNFHHRKGPHRQVVRGFRKDGSRCSCGPDCYGSEMALREARAN